MLSSVRGRVHECQCALYLLGVPAYIRQVTGNKRHKELKRGGRGEKKKKEVRHTAERV